MRKLAGIPLFRSTLLAHSKTNKACYCSPSAAMSNGPSNWPLDIGIELPPLLPEQPVIELLDQGQLDKD